MTTNNIITKLMREVSEPSFFIKDTDLIKRFLAFVARAEHEVSCFPVAPNSLEELETLFLYLNYVDLSVLDKLKGHIYKEKGFYKLTIGVSYNNHTFSHHFTKKAKEVKSEFTSNFVL